MTIGRSRSTSRPASTGGPRRSRWCSASSAALIFGLRRRRSSCAASRPAGRVPRRRGDGRPQPAAQRADGASRWRSRWSCCSSAGLFLRSFLETRDTDPGFRREGVLLAAYDLPAAQRGRRSRARRSPRRLLERLRALPRVEAAAIASSVPLDIHGLPLARRSRVEGRVRADGRVDQALANTVTPGYFAVMGIPLVRGHGLRRPATTRAAPAAGDRQRGVRAPLPRRLEPLGRRLQARGRSYMIAGVVRNSLYNAFGEPPTPIIYFSYRDRPLARSARSTCGRAPGSETAVASAVRRTVRELDPDAAGLQRADAHDHVETNLIFRRIPARMFAVLGPLLLAARGDRHLRGRRLHRRRSARPRSACASRSARRREASSRQFVRESLSGHRRRARSPAGRSR